jgi:hypothetical protein
MPFNFTGQSHQSVAKLGVVSDGDTFVGAPTVLTSGSTATLTLASTTVTLTGGAGFTSGMTGDSIYISGAATAANNGWFTITYISATSVSWTNASGATDANNGAISFSVAALPVSTLATFGGTNGPYSCFTGPPVRTGVGTWSITTKDSVPVTIDVAIKTVLPAGSYLAVQENTSTTVALTGQKVLNWTFNSAGTPTDLPYPGSMRVFLMYAETKV